VGGGGPHPSPSAAPRLALAAWVVVIVVGCSWGATRVADAGVSLRAAPLMGTVDWRGVRGLVPAAAIGVAASWWGPGLARRLAWRALLAWCGTTAVAWTVALAASDGWAHVTAPLATRHEYEPLAARLTDIGPFLRTYVEDLPSRPIHVQGHPPGPVVVARLLDVVRLDGAGWLAALAITAWGGALIAALVALRVLAGEPAARRAAPAVAVVPAAVWAGTSLDALFAGVIALAVALAALATARWSVPLGAAAGTAFGGALLLTYGAVPLVLVVGAAMAGVTLCRIPDRPFGRPGEVSRAAVGVGQPVAAAVVAVVAILVAAAVAGFWWVDGLGATRRAYWDGVASARPWLYLTVVGNPAALCLAVGPAVAVGFGLLWVHRHDRGPVPVHRRPPRRTGLEAGDEQGDDTAPRAADGRPWSASAGVLPVAAAAAVAAADLSQYARGEVERIWLPFVPWLALAAPGHRRRWVAAQVATALAVQAAVRSPW
jgi:methylthioxylose transferase